MLQRADEADAAEEMPSTARECAAMRCPRSSGIGKHSRRIRELKAELEKEGAESRAAQLRENAEELRKKAAESTVPAREKAAAKTLAKKSDAAAEKLSPRDDEHDDEHGDDDKGSPTGQLSLHRVQTTPAGKPKDTSQRNFTDADSRIMIRNAIFLQAYNAQAAVTEDQIVVAHGLTNDPTDAPQLAPMLERAAEATGEMPTVLTADAGYLSDGNITYCAKAGVDAYISVRESDAEKPIQVPDTPRLIAHWDMSEKRKTSRGKTIYALRKILAEPVFGQIKAAMGFRRFFLRGLEKVPHEWGIVCLCHNLLKLLRASRPARA